MCALQLRGSSNRTIERKKQEIRAQDETLTEDQVTRIMRAKMTWWDWFLHDYARYWYALGTVALDVFVGLWLAESFHLVDALGILIIVATLVILLAVEIKGYFWIWPKDVPIED